ncbi:J domain-containing protein [Acinetobacter populi]|uniref:J domain-containing protein n=1 Tax=Acinetobacter populi TaxID=1582270 RepID=A0A1Z9Z272_9GAMM|nr:hypothetical protein [Acinetobacter populi]OUY08539.1 hypothetical protein CAP51_02680 [Acinetobacter populi]
MLNQTFVQYMQQSNVFKILRQEDKIYIAPNIPPDKLTGARHYIPPAMLSVEVLLLLDNTVFGSAKDGLCITERGIILHEPFMDTRVFFWKHMSSFYVDKGFFSTSLYINDQKAIDLTQLDKRNAEVLAQGLRELLEIFQQHTASASQNQQYQSSAGPQQRGFANDHASSGSQSSESDPLAMFTILYTIADCLRYIGSVRNGYCDHQTQQFILEFFNKFSDVERQHLSDYLKRRAVADWSEILDKLRQKYSLLDLPVRFNIMLYALQLMYIDNWSDQEIEYHLFSLANHLHLNDSDMKRFFELFDQRMSGFQESLHKRGFASSSQQLPIEVQQACDLLQVNSDQLTVDHVTKAYRIKMAEFHPDKYQQLPPSVRQLIEQQAQQLNQARDCLLKFMQAS